MLKATPISAQAFAPFGGLIETSGDHSLINEGLCKRFTDLANIDVDEGEIGLSLFQSEIRPVPYKCGLLERHPQGSQCFIPMGGSDYLVIVAPDDDGQPGQPRPFLAKSDQVVNIAKNTWHGVLAPISGSGLFGVIDRIGPGANLEEFELPEPVMISL